MKHADVQDADEAMKIFADRDDGPIIIDPDAEKALLRKIDRNIMPLLCLVYGLNFIDKAALNYAAVMGLQKDLHLIGDNYAWLGSIFYFGYLVV